MCYNNFRNRKPQKVVTIKGCFKNTSLLASRDVFFYYFVSVFISSFNFVLFLPDSSSPNLFVIIFFIKICLSASSFKSIISVPSFATDIFPVSSDTTTTIASDSCEIPAADLCLVPSPFDMFLSFDNGSKHAAAFILFSLIITAPS